MKALTIFKDGKKVHFAPQLRKARIEVRELELLMLKNMRRLSNKSAEPGDTTWQDWERVTNLYCGLLHMRTELDTMADEEIWHS